MSHRAPGYRFQYQVPPTSPPASTTTASTSTAPPSPAGVAASVSCSSATSSTALEPFDCTPSPLFVVLARPLPRAGPEPRRASASMIAEPGAGHSAGPVVAGLVANLKGSSGCLSPSPGRTAQGRANGR